jgi:hypothetical protein
VCGSQMPRERLSHAGPRGMMGLRTVWESSGSMLETIHDAPVGLNA